MYTGGIPVTDPAGFLLFFPEKRCILLPMEAILNAILSTPSLSTLPQRIE